MKIANLAVLLLVTMLFGCENPDDIVTNPQQVNYELGQPVIGGNGCKDSTIHLSEDLKSVEVEFINYRVEAGAGTRSMSRGSCSIVVPFEVPEQYKVAIIPSTIEGSTFLSDESSLKVVNEVFLAGNQSLKDEITIDSPIDSTFKVGNSADLSQVTFSQCAESINLRVNLSMLLKSKNKSVTSNAEIKTHDKSLFKLVFKKCEN